MPILGPHGPSDRHHAIVIGGSMAGLLAARALAGHFRHVTLIERDPLGDAPEARRGQPQAQHLHALLPRGLELLTAWFPELPDALERAGATVGDLSATMSWYCRGGRRRPVVTGRWGVMASRPLLEALVRRALRALPNVRVLDACAVDELLLDPEGRRVRGVRTTRRAARVRLEGIPGDLIVDATGRGSRTPRWLEPLGLPAPPEERLEVGIGYATRVFRRAPHEEDRRWVVVSPEPPRWRGGAAFPIEGGRWLVMLAGYHGDRPGADEASFRAFARSLPVGDLDELVAEREPLSEIVRTGFPASVRRRYERLPRFPGNYLVLGDALCSFNPIYGQGMTTAALQARELERLLAAGRASAVLAPAFFRRAQAALDVPWRLATGEDLRHPATRGRRAPLAGLVDRYLERVQRATHRDRVVCRAFLDVAGLMRPPTELLRPRVVRRVLAATREARSAAARPSGAPGD